MSTTIEWVKNLDGTKGETWNPITGCTKVSEGCKNCYAERIAKRFWKDRDFGDIRFHDERLSEIDKLKKPRRIFVCSMSDLFHENISYGPISDIWDEMICHPRHTFMVLTKRPGRMFEFSKYYGSEFKADNIWLGVTAENQKCADERIPILLDTPAAVRFVSVEPMLSRMDLTHDLDGYKGNDIYGAHLDWCIVGAESGLDARPFDESWARDLKDQCVEAHVPFFFKQSRQNGKLVKMPVLDGRVWNQYPEGR